MIVAFTLLVVAVAAGITWQLAGPRAAALTALVLAVLPPVQRYCYQFGTDLPATAFAGVALLSALRARGTGNRWWWVATGVALALALNAKLIAVFIGPALLLLVLAGPLRRPRWGRTAADLAAAAAGLAAALPLLVAVVPPPPAALDQVLRFHLEDTTGPQAAPAGTFADLVSDHAFRLATAAGAVVALAAARPDSAER